MRYLRLLTVPFVKIYNFFKWYARLYKGRAWYTKALLSIASFFVFMIIFFIMVDINFLWLFGSSPGFWEINNPEKHIASEIYSEDGVMIGKFYSENRTPVSYKAVNPMFWKALIDTEDERFYEHFGVDPEAVLGAAKDALLRQKPRGASTITQQLAKNLFRTRTKHSTGLLSGVPGLGMFINKSKEWILSFKLETIYTKEEIILMYANTVEFGGNIFGIKTAARTYFDKTPAELNTEECAVLVGMLKAITAYNPRLNPERSKQRRNVVLYLMREHDHLSRAECDSLSEMPIALSLNIEQRLAGQAQYFREAVARDLEEWCKEEGIDLYNDGLKIYTTLDTRMQKYAEQAVLKNMRQLQQTFNSEWGSEKPWRDENGRVIPNFIEKIAQGLPIYQQLSARYEGNLDSINYHLRRVHTVKLFSYMGKDNVIESQMSTLDSIAYMVKFMHCGFVAMEPKSGHVKAWVGDVDFKTWQYDKVKAQRQPGSTFKLFVYTEAMNQGLTPCDRRCDEFFSATIWDKKQHKDVVWTPSNANGHFSNDSLTLKTAFARSVNSVAVRLGQELGIERIAETAHEMGIISRLEETPALALGASDVCLLEMTHAYSTVANNGNRTRRPVLVTRIVDAEGREVYRAEEDQIRAIPALSAFFMQQLLKGGLREVGGTSASLLNYIGNVADTDFGGKTGTTNNNSDGWFMCVTPNLVCGAWVGGEYRNVHFRSGATGQGSRTALPICGSFLASVFSDRQFAKYHGRFVMPDELDLEDNMFTCQSIESIVENDTIEEPTDSIDLDTIIRDIDAEELINEEHLLD